MLNATERHALELARQRIAEGKHVHLCYALNAVSGTIDTPAMTAACNRLKSFIMQRLSPDATLDGWIAYHHYDKQPHSLNERREARIQWIDWMLDEKGMHRFTQEAADKIKGESFLNLGRNITINSPRDRRPVRLNTWRP